jgi:hypothetical protein
MVAQNNCLNRDFPNLRIDRILNNPGNPPAKTMVHTPANSLISYIYIYIYIVRQLRKSGTLHIGKYKGLVQPLQVGQVIFVFLRRPRRTWHIVFQKKTNPYNIKQ